jgi:hypothetical protein
MSMALTRSEISMQEGDLLDEIARAASVLITHYGRRKDKEQDAS